ncbi:hypothetical protein ABMA27_000091 [Loxostege sticticalis]|uniref:LIM zinc-binding domain-containing protein n=1 Tax=Loxostege sticticalis TaxID=481309 RepID=A0ABR3IM32_LOXSC
MGVYEERGAMHWQQSERYLSSAYEGGGELSPAAPAASPGSPRDCTSCRKREPPDETPAAPADEPCAGCGARITDRFYLLALERRWHTPCLRCCECKMPLDSEQRCYARDSNIFCKNDYFRYLRHASTMAKVLLLKQIVRLRDRVYYMYISIYGRRPREIVVCKFLNNYTTVLAKWFAPRTTKPAVAGSNPARGKCFCSILTTVRVIIHHSFKKKKIFSINYIPKKCDFYKMAGANPAFNSSAFISSLITFAPIYLLSSLMPFALLPATSPAYTTISVSHRNCAFFRD